eukprot:CAMPEP_0172769498 /NCGR_PEP_ID=MMETSP1074-20121228/186772_1 /TAXON_ID=2916 /ORGANISM="Ceratium fusus, Strain PA161109" /LENGTH=47 /DNA_ID= /DNA_START= /DNA_END= /DNA_ORIENTATION=
MASRMQKCSNARAGHIVFGEAKGMQPFPSPCCQFLSHNFSSKVCDAV